MKCPNCGAKNSEAAKFCSSCGFSLAKPTCPRCGGRVSPGNRYCGTCGAELPLANLGVNLTETPSAKVRNPVQTTVDASQTARESEKTKKTERKQENKDNKKNKENEGEKHPLKKTLSAVLALVIVAGGIIGLKLSGVLPLGVADRDTGTASSAINGDDAVTYIEEGTITGTVVDGETGEILTGVTCSLTSDDSDNGSFTLSATTSADDGSFTISATGSCTVTLEKDGYDAVEFTVDVETQENVEMGEIVMIPRASSATETVYLLSSISTVLEWDDGRSYVSAEYTYDEAGRSLTYTTYDSIREDWYEYIYDDDQNTVTRREPVEQVYGTSSLSYAGLDVVWVESVYDSSNNLITRRFYDENNDFICCDYTYDAGGNVLDCVTYDSNGEIYHEDYTYTFDDDGNVLAVTLRSLNDDGGVRYLQWLENTYKDGKLATQKTKVQSGEDTQNAYYFREETTYTDAGDVLTYQRYYSTDEVSEFLINSEEYTYYENGEKASYCYQSFTTLPAGEFSEWYEYTYDSAGNELSYTVYYEDGSIDYRTEYTRGTEGNIQTEVWYDGDGEDVVVDTIFEYTYDSNGNLIKKVCYDGEGTCYFWHEYTYISMELTADQAERLVSVKLPTEYL